MSDFKVEGGKLILKYSLRGYIVCYPLKKNAIFQFKFDFFYQEMLK